MPLEEEIARTKKQLADLEKQKAMDKDDSDIEVIEAEPNYHGINISWRPLQKFLVKFMRSKHPHIKSQDAAYKQSAAYVNCWNIIGYTYQKLKEKTEDNDLKVQVKKVPTDYFPKYLWTKLNNNREHLANNVSLSFLIDRSLDHFRNVIKLELRSLKRKVPDTNESDSDDIIIESPDQTWNRASSSKTKRPAVLSPSPPPLQSLSLYQPVA